MRNELINLINDSFAKQYEKRGLLTAHHTAEDLISNGVTIQKWIPVEERLPGPGQDVLAFCKYAAQYQYRYEACYICEACYIPPKWDVEESFFSWDSEYLEDFEENDGCYVKSGWYERIHNLDEYSAVGIEDTVTHWMPLPSTEGMG